MNITNYTKYKILLKEHFSITLPELMLDQLSLYHELLSTWNTSAKLLSATDVESRLWDHTYDSLSLLPYFPKNEISSMNYVDIGTGGGFPAIPLILAIQGIQTTLIERNQKKAGFLEHVIKRLHIKNVNLCETSLEMAVLPPSPRIVTSRAVEKPELISAHIITELTPDDIYLCQLDKTRVSISKNIECKKVQDSLDDTGFRRGALQRITRSTH